MKIQVLDTSTLETDKHSRKTFYYHDLLREGRQEELSPKKVSALFEKLVSKVDELVKEVNDLKIKQLDISKKPIKI